MDRFVRTVPVKGSRKQVAWARPARARLVAEAERPCRGCLASLADGAGLAEQRNET